MKTVCLSTIYNPTDCTLPTVSGIELLNGGPLTHGSYTDIACEQSATTGSASLLIGGSRVTCDDGVLMYSGVATFEPRCLGNITILSGIWSFQCRSSFQSSVLRTLLTYLYHFFQEVSNITNQDFVRRCSTCCNNFTEIF